MDMQDYYRFLTILPDGGRVPHKDVCKKCYKASARDDGMCQKCTEIEAREAE